MLTVIEGSVQRDAYNFIWTKFANEADLCHWVAAKYAMISLPAVVMSVMLKTFVSMLINSVQPGPVLGYLLTSSGGKHV